MENRKGFWLDCDPGIDDTMAIILGCYEQQLEAIGMSVSCGNSTVENCMSNCLRVLHGINRLDIEVVQGSSHHLCFQRKEQYEDIHNFHGPHGLTLDWPVPIQQGKEKGDNFLAQIYKRIEEYCLESKNKISFVVTGPLTNFALLVRVFPEVIKYIDVLLVMGGGFNITNITPFAEMNIWTDPEAANVAFQVQNLHIVLVTLDATHQIRLNEQHYLQISGTKFKDDLHTNLRYYQNSYKNVNDKDYVPCHDDFTMYYLIDPTQFIGDKLRIIVETQGEKRGQLNVTDDSNFNEIHVITNVGIKANNNFLTKLIDCIELADQVSPINKIELKQTNLIL